MTLSRLELGFESPWGRQSTETAETVEYWNCRESPKIKGSRFFVARDQETSPGGVDSFVAVDILLLAYVFNLSLKVVDFQGFFFAFGSCRYVCLITVTEKLICVL